jgi:hypothetical protein
MSNEKLKKAAYKATHGKAAGAIKKIGNAMPIVKAVKYTAGYIKGHKAGTPVAQDLGGKIASIGTRPLDNAGAISNPGTIEEKQSNLEKGLTFINTAGEFVQGLKTEAADAPAETDQAPGRQPNPNPTGKEPNKVMAWLQQKWYIPVAAIVVIGGIIYFVKRNK